MRGRHTLSEVASGAREAGVVVVVLLLLVVPGGNGGLEVLVASCKVLTELKMQKNEKKDVGKDELFSSTSPSIVIRTKCKTYRSTAVLELASLDPVVTKLGGLVVPGQGTGTVQGTELVVGVENGLLLLGEGGVLLGSGLGGTLFESNVGSGEGEDVDGLLVDLDLLGLSETSVLEVVRDVEVVEVADRDGDGFLGDTLGRDGNDGDGSQEERGEFDHDGSR